MLHAIATYYSDHFYNDPYYDQSQLSPESAGALFAVLMLFLVPALVIAVFTIIGMWRVFKKAGKPGWAVIVPIYNIIVLLEIVGRPTWWVFLYFLSLIPFIGWIGSLVVGIIVTNDLAKSFGKDVGYTLMLLFVPFVGYMILGFGEAKYKGPAAATPAH